MYGGELLNPKRYGWVAVALKPSTGDIVPDYVKQQISNMLLKYISVPGKVLIQDPEYFYLGIESIIEYDSAVTTKSTVDLLTSIKTAMTTYSSNNFEKFGKDFRYSRFVYAIDNADESIISNDTKVKMIKRLTPALNIATTYTIEFGNAADTDETASSAFDSPPVLLSSSFSYIDPSAQIIWENCYLQDDNLGNIAVLRNDGSGSNIVNSNIGSIDYTTGTVNIQSLMVADYTNHISLYMTPKNKDILVDQKNIILLDLNDCDLTLESTV